MNATITFSERSGRVEYHNISIMVNNKELKMRVTTEDGVASDWHSHYSEGEKWNKLSSDEKAAINKEIMSYFN